MIQDASIAPLVALKFVVLEEMSRTPPLDPPVRRVLSYVPVGGTNTRHSFYRGDPEPARGAIKTSVHLRAGLRISRGELCFSG